ncbi:hypothetical protein N431DRAFT_421915 [Stipitochalara longipes BDJ]|nr:hypothetical protein N431DRAFT_421915 [Stipitochalara longipes BDJ]
MADPSLDPNQVPVSIEAQHAAVIYLGVTVPLYTIALSTLVARITFKLRSSVRIGLDDYLIIIGFVLATIDWALLTAAVAWCTPASIKFTTPSIAQQSIKLSVIGIPFWGFSIGFIKLSVAVLLLRFQRSRPWRLFLYALFSLLALVTLGSCLVSILQCIPLSAVWDPTGPEAATAKCMGTKPVRVVSNFVGGFSIATDLVLSLFPLTFMITLRRPRVEKILISCLMAVGLAASAASIMKAIVIQKWVNDPDGMFVGFTICTLAAIEMLVGSIAACLPCLKSTVQGLLIRCGVDFSSADEDLPSFVRGGGGLQMKGRRGTFGEVWQEEKMPSMSESEAKSSVADVERAVVEVPDAS